MAEQLQSRERPWIQWLPQDARQFCQGAIAQYGPRAKVAIRPPMNWARQNLSARDVGGWTVLAREVLDYLDQKAGPKA